MAIIYVRSTDGSNSDNGSTWALAKATIAGALAAAAAGDTIYVSQAHAETQASTLSPSSAGTVANPIRIICVNDGAEPPTALATTATVTTTGNSQISFGGSFYAYGITFSCGSGAFAPALTLASSASLTELQFFEKCSFQLGATNGQLFNIGAASSTAPDSVIWKDCTVKYSNAGAGLRLCCDFHWLGGSWLSGGTNPVRVFFTSNTSSQRGGVLLVEDVDFTNLGASVSFFDSNSSASGACIRPILRNIKTPASWSGSLVATAPVAGPGFRIELWNGDNAATNYRLWIEDNQGTIRDETTLVRTGGASDGVTPISHKFVTSANANYPANPLESPAYYIPNSVVGTSRTLTINLLHDSVTNLKNDQVWIELHYAGDSGSPLGSFVTSKPADILTAAADLASDSASTWTTTGMSNPNKQKLTVSFTAQRAGVLIAKVFVGIASKTLYVDPPQIGALV